MSDTDYIDLNKETYNTIASQFSGTRDYLWEDLKMLEAYVKPNTTVVDIGCGNGRLYQLFAKCQCLYLGIDQSEELIKLAKSKFSKPNGEAIFEIQEMTDLKLEQNHFDQTWLMASFHHLPDKETRLKSLKQIADSLKSGGEIIMLNWNMEGEWVQKKVAQGAYKKDDKKGYLVPWRDGSKYNYGDRFYYGFSTSELKELAEKIDLTVKDQYYIKRGERSDKQMGDNLISIFSKK